MSNENHVHQWVPWVGIDPPMVHCADSSCELYTKRLEPGTRWLSERREPDAAELGSLFLEAMGPPPWSVMIHLRGADGHDRAVLHGPTLHHMDDTAAITFRVRDWYPEAPAGHAQVPAPCNHPEPQPNGSAAGLAPSGLGGQGSPSSYPVSSLDIERAAWQAQVDAAYDALAEIAKAAPGLYERTCQAQSVGEVGGMIAAWVREHSA